ncbi:MAG TPA: hypothetical protein VMN81_07995 [Vicinamibacterales bacterium]|nr:hypothetical protein [Vicinamibacterales bacterium]
MTDRELDDIVNRVSNALDVPEPSPLFWEHFPGRVRAAVQAEPAAAPAGWWTRRALTLAMSLALVGSLSFWAWSSRAPGSAGTDMPGDAPYAQGPDSTIDAGWSALSATAASAGVEGMREAGFGVTPGGADAAIDNLSDAERATLFALLQAEMDGDDSGGL